MTEVLRLVDCSNNNSQPIDWQAIKKAGAAGGIYKSSEGVSFRDPTFDANWQAIKAAELCRGAYHFSRPEYNNPLVEADLFLRVVGHLEDYDMVALDLESGPPGDLSAWALAWLQDVESALRVPPLLYANLDFVLNKLSDSRLAHYPLWLAKPGPDCPARAGVWDSITLWQRSWESQWPGIQGNVDESVIARDIEGLKKLGKQPVTPPTPPPNAKRYVVLVDMRLRPTPTDDSSFYPPQYCYRGAVLNGTGKTSGPWTQVHAGTRDGWLLTANLKAL